jgi:hypothetical protein
VGLDDQKEFEVSKNSKRDFRACVQQSLVKQPTQIGFSEEKWNVFFQSCDQSDDGRQLYDAGLWFFKTFEGVRKKLLEFPNLPLDKGSTYRMHVGLANRDYAVLAKSFLANIKSNKDDFISPGEMIESSLPIGKGGGYVHLTGTLEAEVSAIRYSLAETLNSEPRVVSESWKLDEQVLNILLARINLAILYDSLSDLWAECLWNGWTVSTRGEIDLIIPPRTNEYISQMRRSRGT